MSKKRNKLKMAGIFFLLLLIAVVGKPETAKAAAEKIELNRSYTVELDGSYSSRLYEFTVPEAGNLNIQAKNSDPAGSREINLQLLDSNNLSLSEGDWNTNVELPVYSTDGGRSFYLKLTGDYVGCTAVLTVNFEPAADWESEENNTTAAADLITAGKNWYGAVNDENDPYDYFKFRLNAGKKVTVTFGPKEVSGEDHRWDVYLINSDNESVKIYDGGSTTQTYTCYLKKGTYFLRVDRWNYSNVNVLYALSYKESALKLAKPAVSSIKCTGYENVFGNYVELDKIRIKNSGDATGYTVRVSNKKNMGKPNTTEEIDFDEKNTKKQISLKTHFAPGKTFYVKARSYVKDPFGAKIAAGKYGAVKGMRLSSSLYKKLTQ